MAGINANKNSTETKFNQPGMVQNLSSLAPPHKDEHGEVVGGKHSEVTSYVGNWTESVQMLEVIEFVKKQAGSGLRGSAQLLLQECEAAVKTARLADFNDKQRAAMDKTWDVFVKHPAVQTILGKEGDKFESLLLSSTDMLNTQDTSLDEPTKHTAANNQQPVAAQ